MRSLDDVRQRAWAVRTECLADGRSLLDGLKELVRRHGITLAPTHPNALEGGDAELQPPVLLYDERFDADPARFACVLAHELGHLELHPRVHRRTYRANPIAAAIYLRQQEVGAVATYSHRLPEETEAIAFANEVTCPSEDAFLYWRRSPSTSLASTATHFGVPRDLVEVQLVEGLYREALGSASSATAPPSEPRQPNAGQEQAIEHTEGPALVLAGPGTGKTWTLVEHALHVLRSAKSVGDNLLILTFSNEAAEELRTRISAALNHLPEERVGVFTFHGFGYYLVRLFHKALGYATPPSVLDEAGQVELFLDAFAQSDVNVLFNLKDPDFAAATAAAHVNYLKQRLRTPRWLRQRTDALTAEGGVIGNESEQRALADLWEVYERLKKEKGHVDFADLISVPVDHFKAEPAALELIRKQFHRVLIDEYQDVSLATGELVRTICLDDRGGVVVPPWVVGDPFQGIYAFLGADVRNVTEFADAFGAEEIGLVQSYRSSRPVVEVANTLASLMSGGAGTGRRLVPAPGVESYGGRPVRLVAALTDAAEHQGVADLISGWLADDAIEPEDVAVLARRNVDVREIAKALAARGHATTTSGIVTAEGAAGDLAAALTLADDPASSIPRLALALGPPHVLLADRNEVIARVLAHLRNGGPLTDFDPGGTAGQQALVEEICLAYEAASDAAFSGDAFSAAVVFLFHSSLYLRRVLDKRDSALQPSAAAEAALALVELATALGHAAAYRFSHMGTPPREARLKFASFFRRMLARSTPSAIAPRRTPGLVRVMTCHASKGLEFPLVAVAGQRLSGYTPKLAWLPPEDEASATGPDQSDALLYVGVTRAERAVVVSYARRPTATGRPSTLPGLLNAWISSGEIVEESWPDVDPGDKQVVIEPVWGAASERRIRTRTLAQPKDNCSIRGYVQDELDLSFPRFEPDLYGSFVGRMRRFVGAALTASHGRAMPLTEDEALVLLAGVWPVVGFEDHRLGRLYDDVARRIAKAWPVAFDRSSLLLPDAPALLNLDPVSQETGLELVSSLAAHIRDRAGRPTGVVFHLGSLQSDLLVGKAEVGWGTKKTLRDRPELALLRSYYAGVEDEPFQAFIYSVEDGELYPFAWPQKHHYSKEQDRIGGRRADLARARYVHEIDTGQCERCGVRLVCPYWTGASGSGASDR